MNAYLLVRQQHHAEDLDDSFLVVAHDEEAARKMVMQGYGVDPESFVAEWMSNNAKRALPDPSSKARKVAWDIVKAVNVWQDPRGSSCRLIGLAAPNFTEPQIIHRA